MISRAAAAELRHRVKGWARQPPSRPRVLVFITDFIVRSLLWCSGPGDDTVRARQLEQAVMALFVCPAPAVIYKRVPGMIRFKFGVFCFNLPPVCYLISRQRNLFVFAPFFLLISCLCVESVIGRYQMRLQCPCSSVPTRALNEG